MVFTGPFTDWIYTYVTIINPSKKGRVVYKFKSNCKRNFTVRPVGAGGRPRVCQSADPSSNPDSEFYDRCSAT